MIVYRNTTEDTTLDYGSGALRRAWIGWWWAAFAYEWHPSSEDGPGYGFLFEARAGWRPFNRWAHKVNLDAMERQIDQWGAV